MSSPQHHFRCADLIIDIARRQVTRDDRALEVSALNFDLLKVLLEASPNVVTYDHLAEKVWNRHFVSPENVAQRVKLLRQSLGDDAGKPRYIETLRGKGYRLIPIVETESPAPEPRASPRRLVLPAVGAAAAVGLAIVGVGWLVSAPRSSDGLRAPAASRSVVVLPFTNLSPNPEDAFLAGGLREEIIDQLGKSNVKVVGQLSVRGDAGIRSVREIVAETRAGAVMEGSVRYSGELVRVTLTLTDTASGALQWSDTFEGNLTDAFEFQWNVATQVAAALGAELAPAHRAATRSQPTSSPEAAALYLRVLDLRRQFSFDHAVQLDYLDKALEFDPQFANAYALKAATYAISVVDRAGGRAVTGDPAALEALAMENAERALQLDPGSAEAYRAIGAVTRLFWRWPESLRALRKAYELSPNDSENLGSLAELLSWMGEHREAIPLMEQAVELEPALPIMRWSLGVILAQAGRTAEAVAVMREAVSLVPDAGYMHHWLGVTEGVLGRRAEALTELRTAERLGATNPTLLAGLIYSYSQIGHAADVARLLDDFEQMAAPGRAGPGTWALIHLARGESDQAERSLRDAIARIDGHEPDAGFLNLMTIKTNVHRNPVLEEPRFRELRARIGMTAAAGE